MNIVKNNNKISTLINLQINTDVIPDSMTMLGQRWPMVVRACWPNIIKKALAQRNFAHRPYVGPRSKMNALVQRWPTLALRQ